MNEQIVKIDDRFYKECEVVMLPSEKPSKVGINHGRMVYANGCGKNPMFSKTKNIIPQHLYIVLTED